MCFLCMCQSSICQCVKCHPALTTHRYFGTMWSASFVQGHVLVECKVVKYVKCPIPISNKFLVDLSKVEVFEEFDCFAMAHMVTLSV